MDERAQLRAGPALRGYPRLTAEIAVCGTTPKGAQVAGSVELAPFASAGALLVDHKSGGADRGLGPDVRQFNAYATLLWPAFPDASVRGAVVLLVDHGRLEVAATDGEAAP